MSEREVTRSPKKKNKKSELASIPRNQLRLKPSAGHPRLRAQAKASIGRSCLVVSCARRPMKLTLPKKHGAHLRSTAWRQIPVLR